MTSQAKTNLSTKLAGGKIAALLQAFDSAVGRWGLANVLQCGLAISRCSFSFFILFQINRKQSLERFFRLVAKQMYMRNYFAHLPYIYKYFFPCCYIILPKNNPTTFSSPQLPNPQDHFLYLQSIEL